jgi:hypothetical protein
MLARLMGFVLLGLIRVLTGSQARWYGCPPKAEQRIYCANHQSHADLVLIWAALPRDLRVLTRPIAARDYRTKTRFRRWITTEVFNAIYVSRERSADQDPLEPLIAALAQGDSVILFPEGTRGNAEEPQQLQWGIMVCIYGMSHVPALLLLDFPGYDNQNAFLVFFLVLVVQVCMVVQYVATRRLNRPPAAPAISRSFNWTSWSMGVGAGSLLGRCWRASRPSRPDGLLQWRWSPVWPVRSGTW